VPRSRDNVRFLCVFIPRDLWNDLTLLMYALRLEGSQKTKGDIVAEALRKHLDDPELQKLLKRARQVYHVEIEEGGGQA